MRTASNPGRVAGVLYLILCRLGPLRLVYIPGRLFVQGNAAATTSNIAAHEWLFRSGMIADVIAAVVLVLLTLAFYRLFKGVDQYAVVLVVILGGVMPALLYLVNVATDATALMVARGDAFLNVFDKPQRDALVLLLLRLHGNLNNAAEMLWGAWLFPLGILIYRSRFMPRFLGVWLVVNGFAYVILCLTGFLPPQYEPDLFVAFQPALFGELAVMLWLVIKGAKPPTPGDAARAPAVG